MAEKTTKDTAVQIRVSSETLNNAKSIFEAEGKSASQAIREFLEETVLQGKTPIRHALSQEEQDYKNMLRKEERAVNNICGLTFVAGHKPGETAEKALLRVIFGEGDAKDLTDGALKHWGKSVGLPETLSLTALSELYDCGLFPKDVLDLDAAYQVRSDNDVHFGAENIRQNMELVKLRLLAGALSAMYEEEEKEEG